MATERDHRLPEERIHHILSNARRRRVIELLKEESGGIELRVLAELIAEAESGESPPPRSVKKSVYNSLHQTHLPNLDQHGIIDYDPCRKVVSLRSKARRVDLYLEVRTPFGVTWSAYYRTLSVLSLLIVIADQIGAIGLRGKYTILISSVFLALVGLSTAYQLWSNNWIQIRGLLGD